MARRIMLTALLLVAALAIGGCAGTYGARYDSRREVHLAAGMEFFYDDLAPYGAWVDIAPYGWVWCPLDVPAGWRPYTVGYWIYTDDGWYWISEDPWGWTPYHYGRWSWDRYYGWIWVPDDVWAPSWCAWRYGDGWVGWAPLPPDVQWRADVGLVYTAYDLDRHIHRYRWNFVHARDFGTTRERVRVEPASRNVTLLKESRNVTKYIAGPRPVEQGMRPDVVTELRDRKIDRYRIEDSKTPIRGGGTTMRDGLIEVYRPPGGITATVRERVRDVPASERPVTPPKLIERVEARRRQLEERVQAERQQLNDEHAKEMTEREPGVSAVELRRRQEAELRAQREMEVRQQRVVEERERRILEEREKIEAERQKAVAERERAAEREKAALERQRAAEERDKAARERDRTAEERTKSTKEKLKEEADKAAKERAKAAEEREKAAQERGRRGR